VRRGCGNDACLIAFLGRPPAGKMEGLRPITMSNPRSGSETPARRCRTKVPAEGRAVRQLVLKNELNHALPPITMWARIQRPEGSRQDQSSTMIQNTIRWRSRFRPRMDEMINSAEERQGRGPRFSPRFQDFHFFFFLFLFFDPAVPDVLHWPWTKAGPGTQRRRLPR